MVDERSGLTRAYGKTKKAIQKYGSIGARKDVASATADTKQKYEKFK